MNVSIDEGDSTFCHELSINFNPLQFIFDFKTVTPRVDVRSKEGPTVHIKHNAVMMEPYHVKKMLELLTKVVADYEKEFGTIEKPEAVARLEKKMAKNPPKVDDKTVNIPTYFG
jgi:hypothetical protein